MHKYDLVIGLDEVLPGFIRHYKRLRLVLDYSEILRIRNLHPYFHKDYTLSYNVAFRYEFVRTKTFSFLNVYLPILHRNKLAYLVFQRTFDKSYDKCDVIDTTFDILCANLNVLFRSYNSVLPTLKFT